MKPHRTMLLLAEPHEAADRLMCETFTALPTLCLTSAQARRLWNLDDETCQDALAELVRAGFLRSMADGRYCRADHFPPDTALLLAFD